MKQPVIQELLARSGIVDASGLERALEIQARDGGSLGRITADLGLCTDDAGVYQVQAKDMERSRRWNFGSEKEARAAANRLMQPRAMRRRVTWPAFFHRSLCSTRSRNLAMKSRDAP